jgi:hypothetical protein
MPWTIRGVAISDKDLNQRYANNYIEIQPVETKEPKVVLVLEFGQGLLYPNRGDGWKLGTIKLVRDFPELGAIEFGGSVHFLRRMPLRQWTRGLNGGVLRDYCRAPQPVFSNGLSQAQAEACFYPKYTPLKEGLQKLKQEEISSFARNQKFWFSGNKRTSYLWYEEVPVGEVKDAVLFFNPQCLILKQEVIDEFKNDFQIV